MALKVIELEIDDSLTGETKVEEIALVLQPAIETEFVFFSEQKFQESYSDYPQSVQEAAQRVLDYTKENGWGTCGTSVGKQRANQLAKGEPISLDTIQRMYSYLSRHRMDLISSKTYDDGCGKLMYDAWGGETALKWSERKLRQIKQEMGYDTSSLSPYIQTTGTSEMCGCGGDSVVEEMFVKPNAGESKSDYISRCITYVMKEGATQEQAVGKCYGMWENFELEDACWEGWEAIGMKEKDGRMVPNCVPKEEMAVDAPDCGCGCWNDGIVVDPENNLYFENILINGIPVFDNEGDAATYAQTMGCSGSHEHIIDGKVYYMPCEVHPPNINELDDYSEEEYEAAKLLKFLAETNHEEFEAVLSSMRGATEQEVYKRNHKNPTIYFKYERVLDGSPDRDFCVSIEGRYFRRLEIDLLRDYNTDFGHQRQPYSKWLYKGGPECVHAWRKFLFQGKNKVDEGFAEGKAGMPPKSMPNNGYYSEETKRKSQQAYIISQKENMSKIKPTQFKYDGDRRMIYSPAMKPGILIPRIDEVTREKYFVTFKPETIEKMAQRYMIDKKSGGGHTNYEHTEQKLEEVYLVESWIVDGEQDKAYSLGYSKEQIPKGTWMVGFRVDSPEVWEMVKNGEIKGISIEGNFEYKFSSQKEDDYLLNEIINIINQIQ